METASPSPASTGPQTAIRPVEWAALALVGLALGLGYLPSFTYLRGIWSSDSNYSQGYLIVPIALAILWFRRDLLDRSRLAPKWWGWALLVGVLVLRAYFYQQNQQWFEDATILLAVASLVLAFGGWHLLRWSLPAIAFLAFMFPLPHRFNTMLASPLQRLATIGSCDLLQTMGLPVLAEGNVLIIGEQRLGVEQACNGLSMLLSFITLITAAAILVKRPLLDRALLLASAIPVALVVNILRISFTGLCFYYAGTDELPIAFGYKLPHDWAGVLMPVIGLLFILLELTVMSWLVVEAPEESEAMETFGAAVSSRYRSPEPAPARKASGAGPDRAGEPVPATGAPVASAPAAATAESPAKSS